MAVRAASGLQAAVGCQLKPRLEASTTGEECSSTDIGDDTCDVVTWTADESELREGDAGTADARCALHHQVG